MINVDISNVWGAISLPDLLGLEAEVFSAHQSLTEGTCPGSEFTGWLNLPAAEPTEETKRILAAARKIRSDSDVLMVIGIGGSYLGARAAIELLQGPNRNLTCRKGSPQILFAGNDLSTRHWNELCRLLEGRDYSLCVISKSGTTLEPAVAFRNLRWMLERKYGTDESGRRIYVVTDPTCGALREMAAENSWETFSIPATVGGRFSVLSPAGLLPMAAAGIDIEKVLRGAWEAVREYDLRSYENPVWLYAAVRNLLHRSGMAIELLESFEPGFQMFGAWWQQLFGESEGKDGKGLFPATATLTTDLYSLGQLIQEGSRNLFETMVRFDPAQPEMIIGEDVKNLDNLNYLAGKCLSYLEEQAFSGTTEAHAEGGVPVITVDCGPLCEETLGQMIWFFQLSCAISARLLGVNPFDQPGVELYKQNMFRLLEKP